MKLESNLQFRPGIMILVPLADVFLTLLIFFLLGSSLVLQSGVRLELPPSSFAVQGLADAHVLVVSAGPSPRLILNQVEVAPHQLAARLDALAKSDRDRNGRVGGLILKADRTTPHGLVSELTGTALARGFRVAWATLPIEGDYMFGFLFRRKPARVPLLFRWRRAHWWSFRLVFLGLFSLFLHLAAFYAFETVYPPSRREVLREGTVWILPPEDAACRALLAQHEEKLRVFSAAADEHAALSMDPITVRYASDNHRPEPMAWPPFAAGSTLVFPETLSGSLPPPAPAPVELVPVESRTEIHVLWQVPGSATPVDVVVPDPVGDGWTDPLRGSAVVFHAGFDQGRRVTHAIILDGPGGPPVSALRRTLLSSQAPPTMPAPPPGQTAWSVVRMEFRAAAP